MIWNMDLNVHHADCMPEIGEALLYANNKIKPFLL